jgi:hypothetical protein
MLLNIATAHIASLNRRSRSSHMRLIRRPSSNDKAHSWYFKAQDLTGKWWFTSEQTFYTNGTPPLKSPLIARYVHNFE